MPITLANLQAISRLVLMRSFVFFCMALMTACGEETDTADMTPSAIDMSPAAPDQGTLSGYFVTGHPVVLDTALDTFGALAYVEGSPSTAVTTAGLWMKIPVPSVACGKEVRLVFEQAEAMPATPPISRTLVMLAPPLTVSCDGDRPMGYMHLIGSAEGGLRSTLAQELASAGEIPAADGVDGATFSARYHLIAGRMLTIFANGNEVFYRGGALSILGDAKGCRRYYTYQFIRYKTGSAPSFLDLPGASDHSWFVVVCPVAASGDLTIEAQGYADADGNVVPLAPVTLPLGDSTISIDWGP